MRWFVMKKISESKDGYSIAYEKVSRLFSLRKHAEIEMKRLKKKHPKTEFMIQVKRGY